MKLEVRCCCNPNKLLGHIDHPRLQRTGDRLNLMLRHPATGVDAEFPVVEHVELMVMDVNLHTGGGWRPAVRNQDYPIETLRLVPGFVEAPDSTSLDILEAVTGHGRY